ncbi:MAG: hypothetical protein SGJ02_05355 [bacterium]|nr:hypothetical protein [bacterium]
MNQTLNVSTEGVCFDPEEIKLLGVYADELSLFRARNRWKNILESTFMLEDTHDFALLITKDYEEARFNLICNFNTACGRYAFWRLTNYQAPEAQYEIETAHIPNSSARQNEMVLAPDMLPLQNTPLVIKGLDNHDTAKPTPFKEIFSKIKKAWDKQYF